jgi:hypothetical protein
MLLLNISVGGVGRMRRGLCGWIGVGRNQIGAVTSLHLISGRRACHRLWCANTRSHRIARCTINVFVYVWRRRRCGCWPIAQMHHMSRKRVVVGRVGSSALNFRHHFVVIIVVSQILFPCKICRAFRLVRSFILDFCQFPTYRDIGGGGLRTYECRLIISLISPDEYWYSFLLLPKMTTATSTEHNTESSWAFLKRPPFRLRKVLQRFSMPQTNGSHRGRRRHTLSGSGHPLWALFQSALKQLA